MTIGPDRLLFICAGSLILAIYDGHVITSTAGKGYMCELATHTFANFRNAAASWAIFNILSFSALAYIVIILFGIVGYRNFVASEAVMIGKSQSLIVLDMIFGKSLLDTISLVLSIISVLYDRNLSWVRLCLNMAARIMAVIISVMVLFRLKSATQRRRPAPTASSSKSSRRSPSPIRRYLLDRNVDVVARPILIPVDDFNVLPALEGAAIGPAL